MVLILISILHEDKGNKMKKECVVCGKAVKPDQNIFVNDLYCDRHYKYYLELELAKAKKERDSRNEEFGVQEEAQLKAEKIEKISTSKWI